MSVYNSLSRSTILFVFLVIVIGAFAGLLVPNTTLLVAARQNAETDYIHQASVVRNEAEREIAAAKTEAEIQRIQLELALQERDLRIKKDAVNQLYNLLIISAVMGVFIILIPVVLRLTRGVRDLKAKLVPSTPSPWDDPSYREWSRAQARKIERESRELIKRAEEQKKLALSLSRTISDSQTPHE